MGFRRSIAALVFSSLVFLGSAAQALSYDNKAGGYLIHAFKEEAGLDLASAKQELAANGNRLNEYYFAPYDYFVYAKVVDPGGYGDRSDATVSYQCKEHAPYGEIEARYDTIVNRMPFASAATDLYEFGCVYKSVGGPDASTRPAYRMGSVFRYGVTFRNDQAPEANDNLPTIVSPYVLSVVLPDDLLVTEDATLSVTFDRDVVFRTGDGANRYVDLVDTDTRASVRLDVAMEDLAGDVLTVDVPANTLDAATWRSTVTRHRGGSGCVWGGVFRVHRLATGDSP